MKEFVILCKEWIKNESIIQKEINIDDNLIRVTIKNDKGIQVNVRVYIGEERSQEENDFLILIDDLLYYYVKSNL